MSEFSEFLRNQLKDDEFKKEYFRVHFLDDLICQLIRLRNKRGLTQTTLAEKAGTTQTVVSRVESGSSYPSIRTLQKLVESMEASIKIDIVPNEEMNYSQFFLEPMLISQESKPASDKYDHLYTNHLAKIESTMVKDCLEFGYINDFHNQVKNKVADKS